MTTTALRRTTESSAVTPRAWPRLLPGLARALRVRPRLPLDVAGAVPAALARRLRRFTGGA